MDQVKTHWEGCETEHLDCALEKLRDASAKDLWQDLLWLYSHCHAIGMHPTMSRKVRDENRRPHECNRP